VIAVGGGALLSAVALVLLPEAADRLAALPLLTAFVAGGVVFFLLDRALSRQGTHAAQFLAMMLDYLPEAMALGAVVTVRPDLAILTAGIIALQNLGGLRHRPSRPSGHRLTETGQMWYNENAAAGPERRHIRKRYRIRAANM
jgi:zinc transporter ZupT